MESMFWRVVTRLGVPGLALGVLYMIILNLELTSSPPEWVGPLKLVTLFLVAAITFYALGLRRAPNIFAPFLKDVPPNRLNLLNNKTWKGTLKQKHRDDTPIEITLEVKGKEVLGKMACDYPYMAKQEFDVSGSFHGDRLLRLDYANKDKTTVHFGTLYFELTADGHTLKGSCVGFGIKAEEIVTADVVLNRE